MPAALDRARRPTAEAVRSALWARVEPADRLEHLRVRVGLDQIDVVAFVLATDETSGRLAAARIVADALRTAPELIGWKLAGDPIEPILNEPD